MLKKHQDLIKKADDLIRQEMVNYDKWLTGLYYNLDSPVIYDIWKNYDGDHSDVCEHIMKRERKQKSILWEAALITVMEDAMVYYGNGYGFRYIDPNLEECMKRYNYIKKLISSKHNPVISLLSGASLQRIGGTWYFLNYQV